MEGDNYEHTVICLLEKRSLKSNMEETVDTQSKYFALIVRVAAVMCRSQNDHSSDCRRRITASHFPRLELLHSERCVSHPPL